MIRRTFFAFQGGCIIALMMVLGLRCGPAIEASVAPIRINQRVEAVTRTADRLCWTWISDKVRLADSDNVDVWLDRGNGDRSYPEVFNRDTGVPWHRNGALPIGHSERPYCIELPRDTGPHERLVLRQVIHYRGALGLWTVLVPLPDVVSDPPAGPP